MWGRPLSPIAPVLCPPSGSVLSRPGSCCRTPRTFLRRLWVTYVTLVFNPWGRALSCSSPSGVMCCRTSRILGCNTPVCLWSAVAPFGVRVLTHIKDFFMRNECCRTHVSGPVSGIKDFFVFSVVLSSQLTSAIV